MRLIKTFQEERKGLAFLAFLRERGIQSQVDIQTNTDWGSANYGQHVLNLWIEEEENVPEALKWLNLFENNPEDPIFNLVSYSNSATPSAADEPAVSPITEIPSQSQGQHSIPWEKQPMGIVTRLLLFICTLLLLLTQLMLPSQTIPEKYAGLSIFTSPVEKALLYDYPKFYQLIDQFIHIYGYEGLETPKELPPEGQKLLEQINHTPYWQGIYHLLVKEPASEFKTNFAEYPRFEKIKEGQIWRLFSPCLLHGDIFHLFFNMLWLIVLGKQIEARLKPMRYLLFMLIIGVISNTSQYLMSGPNFLGFSGILCGMLAFIWVRQKRAAWEGYQIDRLTLLFMLIFILGMAGLQLLSFFIEKSLDVALSPNIANMAHLSGGIVGYFLGRLNFFSWRPA